MNRRNFLKTLLGGVMAVVTAPLVKLLPKAAPEIPDGLEGFISVVYNQPLPPYMKEWVNYLTPREAYVAMCKKAKYPRMYAAVSGKKGNA